MGLERCFGILYVVELEFFLFIFSEKKINYLVILIFCLYCSFYFKDREFIFLKKCYEI